jgi:DNA-3-methyladenine glycosylase
VLPASFYARPTVQVARDLLGCIVEHTTPAGLVAAVIVETEAYVGQDDPACHAHVGRTRRNAVMWGAPGHAYVYRAYGIHWMLNVVTERQDFPAAVLLRAAEPLAGHDVLAHRCAGQRPRNWLVGPGRLTQGLAVDAEQNGVSVTTGTLVLRQGTPVPDEETRMSRRIGITRGLDRQWRFFVAGCPSVSARSVRGTPLA